MSKGLVKYTPGQTGPAPKTGQEDHAGVSHSQLGAGASSARAFLAWVEQPKNQRVVLLGGGFVAALVILRLLTVQTVAAGPGVVFIHDALTGSTQSCVMNEPCQRLN